MEGLLTNVNQASWIMKKDFLAFDWECSSDEMYLEHFFLDLANVRKGSGVIRKAFGKPRVWPMFQEARYWEAVRVDPRHGLEDSMD